MLKEPPGSWNLNGFRNRVKRFFKSEVDSTGAGWALMLYCFLSGWLACVSFSACSIWIGFQTGNSVQVAMALSRTAFDKRAIHEDFRITDWQALCSVGSFALFAQIGGRVLPGSPKSRGRIIISTWMQVILTMLSAITAHLCNEPAFTLNREAPSWHNAYGFATIALLSASFGLQGAAAEPLGTGFGATVVLTSTWVQLSTIPWPWRRSRPRDDRVTAILLFMLGAFISRLLLCVTGSAVTIGIGAGLRALIMPVWMACPVVNFDPGFDEEKVTKSGRDVVMSRTNDSMATMVGSSQG